MAYPVWWTCHTTFWNLSITSQIVFTWATNLYTIWALLHHPGCLVPGTCSLSEAILLTFIHFTLFCMITKYKRVSICSFLCIKLSLTLVAYLHSSKQFAVFAFIHSQFFVWHHLRNPPGISSLVILSLCGLEEAVPNSTEEACVLKVTGHDHCIPPAPQRLLQGRKHDPSWSI